MRAAVRRAPPVSVQRVDGGGSVRRCAAVCGGVRRCAAVCGGVHLLGRTRQAGGALQLLGGWRGGVLADGAAWQREQLLEGVDLLVLTAAPPFACGRRRRRRQSSSSEAAAWARASRCMGAARVGGDWCMQGGAREGLSCVHAGESVWCMVGGSLEEASELSRSLLLSRSVSLQCV